MVSKKGYPYQINLVIAVLSVTMGVIYIGYTLPEFIQQLKCSTCKFIPIISLKHYWYRWCLYSLLIFAGLRLYSRLLGARRLYYLFFAGITIISIHDLIKNVTIMGSYDMTIDVIIPFAVSITGVIYFQRYYLHTLKNR